MTERVRSERISPSLRRLRDYVTTGYSYGDVIKALPQIDSHWRKLRSDEQKQYRQLLLKREKEVDALSKTKGVTGQDKENCKAVLEIVQTMKQRINALGPTNFDDWWEEPTQ